MAYCTAAQVKTYLNITDSSDDALIGNLITRAQAEIDARVGFSFEASSDTDRIFDNEDPTVIGDTLYFDTWCASITTVTNGDSTEIASTKYATLPRNGSRFYGIKLKFSSGYSWEDDSNNDSEGAITITGKWAWSTSAPSDIEHACIRLTGYFYHQRDNQMESTQPVIAEGALILPSRLPQDVIEIIDRYKWRGAQ